MEMKFGDIVMQPEGCVCAAAGTCFFTEALIKCRFLSLRAERFSLSPRHLVGFLSNR